jgi:hypothetical protein
VLKWNQSFISPLLQKDIWKGENRESIAELWVKMLKFYSVDFDMNNHVVCLRTKKIVTRDEKKWSYKKLAIEGMSKIFIPYVAIYNAMSYCCTPEFLHFVRRLSH